MIQVFLVLLLTSIACSILGVFIVLRRLSMVADAMSHTVLLGIVLAFFVTHTIDSPLLLIGASISGILTVIFIEMIGKTGLVKYDDSIGVVFPMMFAIAVILISRFARNVHIDTDIVLMGEVLYAGLNTVPFLGMMISQAAIRMGILLIINILFILIFYKELKLSTFDNEYAKLLGFPVGVLFYSLMTLTSLTAVAAFDAVGSVLVLSFFITPAASALMITKKLRNALFLSAFFSFLTSLAGYHISLILNASMSGMCAFLSMLMFLIVLIFNKNGPIASFTRKMKNKVIIRQELFIIHLGNHAISEPFSAENSTEQIHLHLNWTNEMIIKISDQLKKSGKLKEENGYYILTDKGINEFKELCNRYNLSMEI